jgi:hypothetical protein
MKFVLLSVEYFFEKKYSLAVFTVYCEVVEVEEKNSSRNEIKEKNYFKTSRKIIIKNLVTMKP